MPEIGAPEYQLARFVIERGLGAIYFIAFVVALRQFPALVGERGLDPATRILGATRFWQTPSLFHWRFSDGLVRAVSWIGIFVSGAIVLGLAQRAPLPITMLSWFVLWALYLSIVNVGGRFYGFGWETLLLEAGFLAIFLGNAEVAPPLPVILLFRWLAFRVEFGAGLIKLRGDECWRQLKCMEWHHETQPMPNPLSWFFHRLPRPIHRIEAIGNFVAQLILPFALFLPQPYASVAAVLLIGSQLYLVVSGNYAWLNWITIVVAAAAIGDQVAPESVRALLGIGASSAGFGVTPAWFAVGVLGLTLVVVILSYYPVRNLLSPRQAMNASFEPFHLVNTYGAFGTVGRTRYEVIVEGTDDEELTDSTVWSEYEFKGKPGDVKRISPQVAPYHLRLDWLMWFLPLSPAYGGGWFPVFLGRLILGDPTILRLLRHNPFPQRPPVYVRARLFHYRYTTWAELRATGAWWHRTYAADFVPPLRRRQ